MPCCYLPFSHTRHPKPEPRAAQCDDVCLSIYAPNQRKLRSQTGALDASLREERASARAGNIHLILKANPHMIAQCTYGAIDFTDSLI